MEIVDIVARCRDLMPGGIVCITGGEPTDHDLLPLAESLHRAGFRVHLETSGVRSVIGYPLEWITVSPKVLSGGGLVQRVGHTLKIVVRPEWSQQEAWDVICSFDAPDCNFFHRYLQPMTGEDGRPVNLPAVIEMLTSKQGRNAGARWALSTQAHRNWSVR
jgi:organic radical activating enzyme